MCQISRYLLLMVQELAWAEWQVDYMEGFSFSFPFHVECFAFCGACSVSQPVGTLFFLDCVPLSVLLFPNFCVK